MRRDAFLPCRLPAARSRSFHPRCDAAGRGVILALYREAWRHERAIALLRDEAGTKFDAKCVEALSRVLSRQWAAGSLVAV